MRDFLIVIYSLISVVFLLCGFYLLNLVGFKSSPGGHGDVNVGGVVFMLGWLGVIIGGFFALSALCIIPWRKLSNKPQETSTNADSNKIEH